MTQSTTVAMGASVGLLNGWAHGLAQKIANNAESHIGSTEWAYATSKDEFGENSFKCNKFCFDVLAESGINSQYTRYGLSYDLIPITKTRPYTAGEWGDANVEIPNWKVVNSPRRGDIAAYKKGFINATGHVGFYTGGGKGTWANSTVIRQDYVNNKVWNTSSKIIYRRYTGK